MVLEKRQKAFVATFFLGLIGLVMDRVLLRPQGPAETASAAASETYAVPVSTDDPVALPPQTQDPTVAERLDRLWPDREVTDVNLRDPFSLMPFWQTSPEGDAPPAPDEATVFARTHPLVAVVMDGRQSYVLVNDRVLSPGDQVDGFTLVSVGVKSALFERRGKQIVLELVSK
jgi:hypothetical protein